MNQDSRIEYFTDPPALAVHRIIARILGDPSAAAAVAGEIESVQRGDFARVTLELDPLSASLVLCYLNLGMKAAGETGSDRHIVQGVMDGLEAHIGQTCPALATVMREKRQPSETQPPR